MKTDTLILAVAATQPRRSAFFFEFATNLMHAWTPR